MSFNSITLDHLPLEVWSVISQSLVINDYKNVRQVCTLFQSVELTKYFQQGQQYANAIANRAVKNIFDEEKKCVDRKIEHMHWSGKLSLLSLTPIIGIAFGVHYLLQSHRLDKICIWTKEWLADDKSIQNGMANLTDGLKNCVSSLFIDDHGFLGKKRCRVIRSFPRLQEIHIQRATLTDAFFAAIAEAHVKRVSIETAPIFCRLQTCINQLRDSLEELYFRNTKIDDRDIAALSVLRKLKKLEIRQCERVTGATFHLLPDSLEELHCQGVQLHQDVIANFTSLHKNTKIHLLA